MGVFRHMLFGSELRVKSGITHLQWGVRTCWPALSSRKGVWFLPMSWVASLSWLDTAAENRSLVISPGKSPSPGKPVLLSCSPRAGWKLHPSRAWSFTLVWGVLAGETRVHEPWPHGLTSSSPFLVDWCVCAVEAGGSWGITPQRLGALGGFFKRWLTLLFKDFLKLN